ncbi:MAG: DMT family transporter [Pseudobdellovibrionaceae bacterium]|nr:DMT family transporter [Pseudobdellovibrionaceae bacterium]
MQASWNSLRIFVTKEGSGVPCMSDQLPFWIVLLSALLHAVWNLQAKKTQYKGAFLWWITVWGCLFIAPLVIIYEWPRIEWTSKVWLFPALSVVSHATYTFCLAESYRRVPFSIAYPVSRGLAQVLIVLAGLFIFQEKPGPWALAGVGLILIGIQATAAGAFEARLRILLHSPWPLLVAVCICFYTTIDHQSVQILPPLTVCLISNIGQCLILARLQLREYRTIPRPERSSFIRQTILWGAVSTAGYSLFLYAQHIGGLISLVGPLRETSVLMGMILSFFVLKEGFEWRKVVAAFLIVSGIFLMQH